MSDTAPLVPQDPRFAYKDIAPPTLEVSKLDDIALSILDPTPEKQLGVWGLIVNAVRAVVAAAWLIARRELIAQQQAVAKQQYEREQDALAQKQVNDATSGLNVSRPGAPTSAS